MLSRKHLASATPHSDFDPKWWLEDAPKISQIAGLLNDVIGSNEDFRDLAVDWLVSPNGGGVGEPIGIRRALVCVLSKGEVVLKGLLEKSLGQFGDKIWIRHTPIMRQEGWFFQFSFLFFGGYGRYFNNPHTTSRVITRLRSLFGFFPISVFVITTNILIILQSECPTPAALRWLRLPSHAAIPLPPRPLLDIPQRRLEPPWNLLYTSSVPGYDSRRGALRDDG